MDIETLGSGPRVVLVHGSVGNGTSTWAPLGPLAERWTLVILNRPGFPPGPPADRIDFEEHARLVAQLLQPGDHLVGHSYGGVISLFAAAERAGSLASLTVAEPPAFGLARGRPEVDAFVADAARHWAAARHRAGGPAEPRAFLEGFLRRVGSPRELPDPLPPDLEQGARMLMIERLPWEAEPPLEALAAAPFPKLVVSGAHSAAFDAVCDVLQRELGAERAACAGAGHAIPRAPGFTEVLESFLRRARR